MATQTIPAEHILLERLKVVCERHGILTAGASAAELIERIDRRLGMLTRALEETP